MRTSYCITGVLRVSNNENVHYDSQEREAEEEGSIQTSDHCLPSLRKWIRRAAKESGVSEHRAGSSRNPHLHLNSCCTGRNHVKYDFRIL